MKTGWLQRVICFILAFVMVLGFAPVPAIAAESDGLCEHHTEHTASCGYSPAVDGHACGHEHTDECYQSVTQCVHTHGDCGYVPAVEGHGCSCQPDESGEIVHAEGCGYVEAAAEVPCNHVCSAETGCITRELNCRHEHDSDCGYVEATQESPCGFECLQCIQTPGGVVGFSVEAYSTDYPNTWTNTGNQAYDIAQIALTQVGYTETGDNHTKYNEWYYGYDQSAAWCAIFVSWCADQAGVSTIKKSTYAYPGDFGISAYAFGSITPQTGDIVFFENNGELNYGGVYGYDHVGIVYSVDNTYIYTVEGNKSDRVQTRKYLLSTGEQPNYPSTYIAWVGRPQYSGINSSASPTLSISGWRDLTQLNEGSSFGLRGTISTDYGVITSVTGSILNSGGSTVLTHTDTPNTSAYNIQTGINNYLSFDALSSGSYTIKVQATANNNGKTNTQELVNQSFTVGTVVPAPPTNFVAEYVDDESARLSWSASAGATSYEVQYWSPTGSVWKTDSSYSSGTSYVSTGLKNYASWSFRVRAVNSAGSSDWVTYDYEKTHTHSFVIESEAEHPHKEYRKCYGCGYYEYTGNLITVDSCSQCNAVTCYSFDLNGLLDYAEEAGLGSFGTCDVYINGALVADDCSDYYSQSISQGSTYEIKDIRPSDGHNYAGVYAGQLSGTVNANTEVILRFFSNPKATLSQNTTDIVVEKYGAYITYSYTGDTAHGYGYTIESSNPAVATVSFRGDNAIAVYGVSVGTCKIVFQLVETDTNIILDTAECTVKVSREGDFGDGLKYTVTTDGHMTVSGTGAIPDYNMETSPWWDWHNEIKKLTIGEGITRIGWSAFLYCESLQEATLPDSLREIETSAFAFCTSLKEIVIPGGVETLNEAFCKCAALENVIISDGVQEIVGSFLYCTGLKTITIPESVTSITESAFGECSSLTDVYYAGSPKGWEAIAVGTGNDALTAATIHYGKQDETPGNSCGKNLTWTLTDGVLTISGSGDMEDYNTYPPNAAPWCDLREQITSVVVCDGVAGIGEYAFFECSNLTSVTLAESVTSIGEGTFCGCESLTSITLPDSVSFIGENAFGTCRSLTSVNIPASLKSIEGGTFQNCEGLTSITIPDSVTSIGAYAFNWCKSLTSVDIPDSVTSIKNGTFEHCEGLTSITIPDSVTSIGDWAFYNCTGLTGELAMPNSLKTIGENAFESCTGLTGIALNEGLTSIGYRAFAGCTGLTGELVIPSSVETIREDAFSCCPGLTSVTLSEGLTRISDGVFSNCTGLTGELVIPNSVESIGNSSFAWCANLNSVVIPASVTEIGAGAFQSCNALGRITFGQSREHRLTIRPEAFCLEAETPLDTGVFAPNAQGMNAAITGYDWDGSNRCVSFVGMNRMDLAGTELTSQTVVWIDGEACPVQRDEYGGAYVNIPENAHTMVTYTFNDPNAADVHTQYPTGMKVWILKQEDGVYTAEYVPELDNLLRYSGSSIRIAGVKGIRMITSVDQNTRDALTGNGLAGFRLVEYGTLLAQTGKLGSDPLVLGGANVRSNYAYRRGVADPVFKRVDGLIQYTNVLVGFTQENCKEDIAMRPYIILEDEAGQTYTIYGGIVYRSVGYIAYQNRNAFAPGSAAYQYVWDIIHYVYGDQYDADYKG